MVMLTREKPGHLRLGGQGALACTAALTVANALLNTL